MKKPVTYLALVVFIVLSVPAIAAVITVNIGGGAAYTSIQPAIDAAQPGDEVHVAFGTYTGPITMKNRVNVFGGYSGASWTRNIEANPTIIDAKGHGSAVTFNNTTTATIDGFTITGGSSGTGFNAGVYVSGCSPTITDNKITGNGKYGIYVYGASSLVIEKNVIYSNSTDGIYCEATVPGGVPLIYNNTIDNNSGHGIALYAFSPNIENDIITSNGAYGIYADIDSYPLEDYNDLYGNKSSSYYGIGAGLHDKSADPLYVGGGDYHLQTSPTLSPCIDAGVYVGLPYNGNAPDMGAYESPAAQPVPWPPVGLTASPRNTMVRVTWQPVSEPNVTGYKLSYGNVSGNYTNMINIGNVTLYDVRGLTNNATYYFAVRSYGNYTSAYSKEISATPTAGTPELPHYSWDESYTQPYSVDCTGCHIQPGTFLAGNFDYHYSSSLCLSCHNSAGQARGKNIGRPQVAFKNDTTSHPVFIDVTTGGCNVPTYGNITGRFSNRMQDHLDSGKIVCNTCHNSMEKTEDPGRTWEMTTQFGGYTTFSLQNGGWAWYNYLIPNCYTSITLEAAPADVKTRRMAEVPQDDFTYSYNNGTVTLHQQVSGYVYVSLDFPYLRVDNTDNAMCLDCHNTGTHEDENCLTCHQMHNYQNLHGIRSEIMTPNSGLKKVIFLSYTGDNSFADSDSDRDGVCEVCHTTTKYYRNYTTAFVNHSGGFDYDRKNCTLCHAHDTGFAKY